MECIAVDWSGARTGAAARIWVARALDGILTDLVAPGSRDAVQALLRTRRADPAPCLVGLDFAFGLPGWYGASRGWRDVRDTWRAARDDGESWLADCTPPFWGRPGKGRPHPVADGLRVTDARLGGRHQPKSVFQIGGAGAVGTGSVRGMPMLLALRAAGWSVWPLDVAGPHTLVEIYPRYFTGPVIKRSAPARRDHLAHLETVLAPAHRAAMEGSEDAFDAGLSAIAMSRLAAHAPSFAVGDPCAAQEGWIWAPPASSP